MSLLPAINLLLFALLLYLVAETWPEFNYYWLIAVAGAILSWITVIGVRFINPVSRDLLNWIGTDLLQPEGILIWDPFSWQYSLVLCTLTLSVVLTDVISAPEGDWRVWAMGLLLSAIGLLALQSGNLFTLFLGLTALDLVSAGLGVLDSGKGGAWFRTIVVRGAGSGLIFLAGLMVAAKYSGPGSVGLGILFFLGCGLRFAVPDYREVRLPRGLAVLATLVPASAGLTVYFRLVPLIAAVSGAESLYILLSLITGLAGAVRWIATNRLAAARTYWVHGLAGVFVAAVLLGAPGSAMTWGLGLIVAGGVLFLYRRIKPWLVAIPAVSVWAISGLPFSPLASGQGIYQGPLPAWVYLVLLMHGLMLAGFLQQFIQVQTEEEDPERWVLFIYPIGLILLLVTFVVMSLIPWQDLASISLAPVWPGFVASALGGIFWWLFRRVELGVQIDRALNFILDLAYLLTQPFLLVGKGAARMMNIFSRVLEGQGGILWAILLIVLVLSLITRVNLGGLALGN